MQRPNIPPLKSSSFKSQKRRRYRRRKKSKSGQSQSGQLLTQLFAAPGTPLGSAPLHPNSLKIWQKTYENLTRWQIQYRAQYWCDTSNQLRVENAELRKKLDEISSGSQCSVSKSTVETDDDDSDSGSSVDEKYLEFMIKTREHQTDVQNVKDLDKDGENKDAA